MYHFHSLHWSILIEIWRVGKKNRFILGMSIEKQYFGELQCLSFEHGDHVTVLSLMTLLLCSLSPIQISDLLPGCKAWTKANPELLVQLKLQNQTHNPNLSRQKKGGRKCCLKWPVSFEREMLKYQCKHSLL